MRILLIDKTSESRHRLKRLLCEFGYQVEACVNARSAFCSYSSDRQPIVIVNGQGQNGFGPEICRQFRNLPNARDAALLVLPHEYDVAALRDILNAGADDYLPAPEERQLFEARIAFAARDAKPTAADGVSANHGDFDNMDMWRAMLDGIPDCIYFKDSDDRFVYMNQAGLRRFGVDSIGHLTGTRPTDVLSDDVVHRYFADDPEVLESGKMAADPQIRDVTRSGEEQWFSSTKLPLRDTSGHPVGVVGIIRDITVRKAHDAQQSHAQKMEAIRRLAGGLAHGFNNLLTIILGYGNLLDSHPDDQDFVQKGAREIKKAAVRATGLTRQLLAISRKQILQFIVVDLNDVLIGIGDRIEDAAGDGTEVYTRLDSNLGCIKADPDQLEQVILNITQNACDAMPGDGKLIIETTNVDLDESYASRHDTVAPGRYVMLAITDSGSGMTVSTTTHIFDPFFTTKDTGHGLGLSTVYGIVKQCNGYVLVYSEVGHGTTFKVYLPRVDSDEPVGTISASPESTARGSETILVVEDEFTLKDLVSQILENAGYSILAANDGKEAMELERQYSDTIDLLLTDVIMPGISGPKLAAELSPIRPDMKVLYMSGYTEDSIIHKGVIPEGTEFLQKPFTPGSLSGKVRAVLDA